MRSITASNLTRHPAGFFCLENGPLENGPLENGPLENGPLENGPLENGPLATAAITKVQRACRVPWKTPETPIIRHLQRVS